MNFDEYLPDSEPNYTADGCLLCNQGIFVFNESVFDSRFGIEGYFNIYRCGSCGLFQLSVSRTSDELKGLYETYYNFSGNKRGFYVELRNAFFASSLYRLWMILDGDLCFHSRRGNGRLLDIGCNEGQGLNFYNKNGFIADGLEVNQRAAAVARKKGFRVFTEPLDGFWPEELYDVVVLSHVLEHSIKPEKMLNDVARILKPDGQVWISCPNVKSWQRNLFGRYWINWHVPFHITFFSVNTLKILLNNTGFEATKVKYATPGLWVAQSVIATLFAKNGRKNYAQRSPILLGVLMFFVRTILFPILWFGNLLGRGDCLILELKKKQTISTC